jgi:hypothetical protein
LTFGSGGKKQDLTLRVFLYNGFSQEDIKIDGLIGGVDSGTLSYVFGRISVDEITERFASGCWK